MPVLSRFQGEEKQERDFKFNSFALILSIIDFVIGQPVGKKPERPLNRYTGRVIEFQGEKKMRKNRLNSSFRISRPEGYLMKLYDLELNQAVQGFQRNYRRVKGPAWSGSLN